MVYRLLESLKKENILVRRAIINQVLPTHTSASASSEDMATAAATTDAYLNKLRQGQIKSLNDLSKIAKEDGDEVPIIKVPYFDMEVRTVYGLRTIGNYLFPKNSN